MFRTALASGLAVFASADVNVDHRALLTGAAEPNRDNLTQIWEQYVKEFEGIAPVDLSESQAHINFFTKLDQIIEHNRMDGRKFDRGLNAFTAMSWEQVKEHFKFDQTQANAEQNCSATQRSAPLTANGSSAPASWNWQDHGGVSPVKDQGSCGSCWTFSTVGCLESANLIQNSRLVTYSEQQLVDCAQDFDNHGCNGGLPSHAFEYVFSAGGISTEDAYPYYAKDRPCTVSEDSFRLSVGHSQNITAGDEDELKEAVYKQPVSVAFQVADDFDSYSNGTYTSTVCNNTASDVNHAVLAVGYGTDDNGVEYWLIKNSWGTKWGMDGFFQIERGVNMCGIAQCNSYPETVAEINSNNFIKVTPNMPEPEIQFLNQ